MFPLSKPRTQAGRHPGPKAEPLLGHRSHIQHSATQSGCDGRLCTPMGTAQHSLVLPGPWGTGELYLSMAGLALT